MITPKSNIKPYSVVILDIEGTTTPIDFVSLTLFPYARKEVDKYILNNWGEEGTQNYIENLRRQAQRDLKQNEFSDAPQIPEDDQATPEEIRKAAVANVHFNMDKDRKLTPLKELQGKIWEKAYQDGEIRGYVYDDVVNAFKYWKQKSTKIYIYSSGSKLAQKLLFGNTSHDADRDLLPYISAHYDTIYPGSKVEAASYEKISNDIKKVAAGVQDGDILFVTDNILEAEACRKANIQAVLAIRDGNKPLPESHTFEVIHSFDQLLQ
ncbi:enolase-phosphatase E1 [Acrasis kona]|uniref:Enolase-phosphatase E1 n=1 Tax=Acrasis kona TaxID=1008807 RepID=A0AAW2ZRE9_9EUKA